MILLLLAACGAPSPVPPPTTSTPAVACGELPDVSWDAWGNGFFRTYCTACHSSANVAQRGGAPIGVDFDTRAAVEARASDVRRVVLEQGTMPVGGGVFPDDLLLLEVFLSCGLSD
ncbi:MAG: hypothetical protein Q8P18_20910 [Pseudomonadota bacterium]|nr:hypothetical protein [Pseudomonadota bacterium]